MSRNVTHRYNESVKQIDYGRGSILRAVVLSAGPMVLAQVLSLLYNIVDRMYIGRIPGEGAAALGGIGLCFPFLTLIAAFANLFGSGGAPLCAIECGKGNRQEAAACQACSLAMILITGLVLTGVGEVFCTPILRLFGATEASLGFAVPYMQLVLTGTVFSMISLGMNPFLNAQGFPMAGMMTVLTGAVLNILLDPVLIFTFGMGIAGAAIATVISQAATAALVLFFLLRRQADLRLSGSLMIRSLNGGRISRITSLGFAGFVMQCTNSLVQAVSNNVLGRTGGDLYISVMTIVSSVRQILDTPIFGLTDGAGPVLSYNYGAGLPDRVCAAIRLMTLLGVAYTCLVWGLILLFPGAFISLFSSDSLLQEASIPALTTYFFAFVFQALQYAGQTTFKSLNRKKQAIFFSLFRKVILVVPLTFLLPVWFGPLGVFAAEPVSNVIGGTACFVTMIRTVYRRLRQPDASLT